MWCPCIKASLTRCIGWQCPVVRFGEGRDQTRRRASMRRPRGASANVSRAARGRARSAMPATQCVGKTCALAQVPQVQTHVADFATPPFLRTPLPWFSLKARFPRREAGLHLTARKNHCVSDSALPLGFAVQRFFFKKNLGCIQLA